MQKRVFRTIDELNESHKDAVIVLVCHSGVMAALRANHIGQDFGEHNISEAYPHDYVGKLCLPTGPLRSSRNFMDKILRTAFCQQFGKPTVNLSKKRS